jgi:hypothetical protein
MEMPDTGKALKGTYASLTWWLILANPYLLFDLR